MHKINTRAKHQSGKGDKMKTYTFKVVVEPDDNRWFAYCPILEPRGAATWGYSKEEALKNIQEVVQMVIESMVEHKEAIPEEPKDEVKIFPEPLVAVTVGL